MNKFIFPLRPSPYMLNNLFVIVCCYLYLGDPWPRPKEHCAHFKISVLKYCRVLKQSTIKSHQGGPVICVQNDFPFFVRKGSFSVQQGVRVDAQGPFSYTLPQKETERLRLSHNIGRAIVEIKERKTFDVALISISYTIFKPSF